MESSTAGTGLDAGHRHGRAAGGSRRRGCPPAPALTARFSWARARRLVRGVEADPAWARPAFLALLVLTALLYIWGLGRSGWANSYYAAAVQAGTQSWKAFFFGSFDSSNFITIDKTPAALWVMGIFARVFGLELVEPAGSAGAGGRRHRRRAVRGGAPVVGTGGGSDRRSRGRRHTGRRTHVPLQQPGRAAHAAARLRRLRDPACRRRRKDAVAGPGRSVRGLRLPHEDAAGLHRAARLRARVSDRRSAPVAAQALASWCWLWWRSSCRPAGGWRSSSSCRPRPDRTSGDRPPTASCSSPSATTGWVASPATRSGPWARAKTAPMGAGFGGATGITAAFRG